MLLGGLLHSGIVACLRIVIVKESSDLVRLTAAAGGAFPVRPIECLALLLGVPKCEKRGHLYRENRDRCRRC